MYPEKWRSEMKCLKTAIVISLLLSCATTVVRASVESGDTAMKKKDYRGAIKQYEAHLKKKPKDGDVMVKAALAYEGAKWWGQSVQWWEKYIDKFPKGDEIVNAKKHAARNHRWIGVNYYNVLGESPEIAVEHLKRAIELDPKLVEAYTWLARIYSSEGDYAKAFDVLTNARRETPNDKLVAWMLKTTKGQLENGSAAYDKYQRGVVQYEKGDKTSALESFKAAASDNPNFSAAHLWTARVLFEQGDFEKSIPEWQTVLNLEPDNARAKWFLGQARKKSGAKQ